VHCPSWCKVKKGERSQAEAIALIHHPTGGKAPKHGTLAQSSLAGYFNRSSAKPTQAPPSATRPARHKRRRRPNCTILALSHLNVQLNTTTPAYSRPTNRSYSPSPRLFNPPLRPLPQPSLSC
jgi:hypothetical protein